MGSMIFPLAVVLVAALIVLGLVVAERYPVATWRDRLRDLAGVAREKEEPVTVVPQEARLEDLMTEDDSAVYVGTESFSGLVDVVEKAMDTAEAKAAEVRRNKPLATRR
ncbi:hypothetical protein [Actinomyces sp. MRS3W]|uniref:hypothetical protein n=1 Tax=Actinomyces sp. MRS3W TaxID=2800796 RepID=UPI0028FD41EB|nr:hypothetical protein [Actinomyces sp. MRS3W]MDU0347731.1 hypothetical protein [Actinomyces sp. MRS3W]